MPLLDLILPPACGACGRFGEMLCRECRGRWRPASDPGDRFLAVDPGVVVGDALEVAVAAFRYEGSLRRALARLKYAGARQLAAPIAAAAAPSLATLRDVAEPELLVPVPVHAERLRERGYNQAALLAAELARGQRLATAELLLRTKPTTRQHRLNRAARLRNMRNALAMRPGCTPPRSVVLVDDILTTSATLEACAEVLRDAGVRHVLGFAVAREV